MGKYRYERLDQAEGAKNVIQFDSSPKYSICKQFGFAEQTFRLEETSRNGDVSITYDVLAGQRAGGTEEDPTYTVPMKRGVLVELTSEELLRKFG